ncbi:MAG: phosphatase PAP2 family protein [Syntrophothermus sp.]
MNGAEGIAVIKAIQSVANPVLDAFFVAMSAMGSEEFFVAVIGFLYWNIDKRLGYRLGAVLLSSQALNSYLKDLFHTPRPSPQAVRVLMPEWAAGYAFPSGHAQGATTFWGFLALQIRRAWFFAAAALMIFLVSLSRLYLGVHFPVDLFGGFLLGITVLIVAHKVLTLSDKGLAFDGLPFRLALALGLPLLFLLFSRTEEVAKLIGLLMGISAGYALEGEYIQFQERQSVGMQLLKTFVGLSGMFVLRLALKDLLPPGPFFALVRYLVLGLWATAGAPWLFVKFN